MLSLDEAAILGKVGKAIATIFHHHQVGLIAQGRHQACARREDHYLREASGTPLLAS